jgi:hypothetical protein
MLTCRRTAFGRAHRRKSSSTCESESSSRCGASARSSPRSTSTAGCRTCYSCRSCASSVAGGSGCTGVPSRRATRSATAGCTAWSMPCTWRAYAGTARPYGGCQARYLVWMEACSRVYRRTYPTPSPPPPTTNRIPARAVHGGQAHAGEPCRSGLLGRGAVLVPGDGDPEGGAGPHRRLGPAPVCAGCDLGERPPAADAPKAAHPAVQQAASSQPAVPAMSGR